MQCNATTEWWQVLTQTGVLLVYLQRDVISAGQTLTHGGERHLLDVPDALVDAVDGLVTLPLPRSLVPVTTEEMSLLQGCRINAVFFSLKELDFSIQSRYCTLQYHKTGESVQMWVFLLMHMHTRAHTHTHTHTHTLQFWLVDLGGQCVEGSQMGSEPSRCSCYCWECYSREDAVTDLRSGCLYALCAEAWCDLCSVSSRYINQPRCSQWNPESLIAKYNPVTPDTVCYFNGLQNNPSENNKPTVKQLLVNKTYCV